ncbi:hypothetical protein ACIA8O_13100 [Kitasatospora sp. NPDC051853]|uniref:hypothetical protein n=1 Tax=Kitasatospora sp. NPDC051853 TaxID=3364058 RepID=UPI0037AC9F9E
MGNSMRIACAAVVVAFTVGLGVAAADAVVADRSDVQRTATPTGFDWDTPHHARPAQS